MDISLYIQNSYGIIDNNSDTALNNIDAFSQSKIVTVSIRNSSVDYNDSKTVKSIFNFSPSVLLGKYSKKNFNRTHSGSVRVCSGSVNGGGMHWKSTIRYFNYLSSSAGLYPAIIFARKHYLMTSSPHRPHSLNKISRHFARYSIRPLFSNFNSTSTTIVSSSGSYFFQKTFLNRKLSYNHKVIFKLIWRFFKLKVERFFFKMTGVRTHIWFMSIWQIFMCGLPSRSNWDYFEAKKIIEYTRRGHRYVIESPEDAKFFIRVMVVMFTFVGGLKLFLDRVSDWMSSFRNHWAYIRFIAETVRRCSNFFWFRFFLNFRISLQGKIGGQLRAQKKIFNRGNISIENRSTMIDYHRCFSNTKFGIFNLSMWVQFKVPSVTESFGGHTLISTMEILLSRYSVPWLAKRLANVIRSIDRDEKKRKSFKLGGDRGIVGRKYRGVQKRNGLPRFVKKKLLRKHGF